MGSLCAMETSAGGLAGFMVNGVDLLMIDRSWSDKQMGRDGMGWVVGGDSCVGGQSS